MTNFFGSGPLPDWEEVRKWLGKEFPRGLAEQWEKTDDGEWLDRMIKGLFGEGKQQNPRAAKTKRKGEVEDWISQLVKGLLKPDEPAEQMETKSLIRMDTVKKAKRVTVTLQLPRDTNMRRLQIFATSELLRVTGLPDHRSHTVRFPCRVFPRSGRAALEGDRIVVKFRRRPVDQNEVELFIRT